MHLLKQLSKKKNVIIKKWFDKVVDSYPTDTARFLKSQKDPFANPVGQTTLQGLDGIIDLLSGGIDPQKAKALIDPIIRIRAIQDFTAARAVRFVFELKDLLHDLLPEKEDRQTLKALQTIDRRIDELGLVAFDVYMQCREKLYDLQANEMKARTYSAFARAGLIKASDETSS